MKTCSSTNLFFDTNVLLSHANSDAGSAAPDIEKILEEAYAGKRSLWVSSIIFAELRPSLFVAGKFESVTKLASYIRSIATVVSPDPDMMLRAGRLRDQRWNRSGRTAEEKYRTMSLGDALHIVSALWVKEATNVPDLQFLTFDDGKSRSDEGKSLSLLRLEEYTDGISNHPDVIASAALYRTRPILSQTAMF
ncbi:PIN domain-containing protein [Neorhizobium sp. NCHU2750]|uniref:type II toxin-antitoxin system VapC family toxin n=1 Tax=Neorhizobium sp. NCHU2750 TaxID=1825976 RepID=UPI0013C3ED25